MQKSQYDAVYIPVERLVRRLVETRNKINNTRNKPGSPPPSTLYFETSNEHNHAVYNVAIREFFPNLPRIVPKSRETLVDFTFRMGGDVEGAKVYAKYYLKPVVDAIRFVDASAPIVLGNVAPVSSPHIFEYERTVLEHRFDSSRLVRDAVDYVAIHYPDSRKSNDIYSNLSDTMKTIDKYQRLAGPKGLWVTESGWKIFDKGYAHTYTSTIIPNVLSYALDNNLSHKSLRMFFYQSYRADETPLDQTYDFIATNIFGYGVVEKQSRALTLTATIPTRNFLVHKFQTPENYVFWISRNSSSPFNENTETDVTLSSIGVNVDDAIVANLFLFKKNGPHKIPENQYSVRKINGQFTFNFSGVASKIFGQAQESLVIVVKK